jgi:ABC-2 type transport system ATP-binding protein
MEALCVEGLCKRYGATTAVDGVDLVVPEGEIFGILGPNGSAKTTTVECAYGLRTADAGRIRVFGLDPQAEPDRVGRLVGTQLQDSALPDRITVGEAVHLFAAVAGGPVDETRAMDRWGLTAKRRAKFGSLSGGQRQRLFIALALLGRPRLVFLDEMTTGLDPGARRELWQLIEEIRDEGTTVVLVTHFMDEAQRLCDRVAVIVDGRVRAVDTPAGLVGKYGGGLRVQFTAPPDLDPEQLATLPGAMSVSRHGEICEVRGHGPLVTALGYQLTVDGHGDLELDTYTGQISRTPTWPSWARRRRWRDACRTCPVLDRAQVVPA